MSKNNWRNDAPIEKQLAFIEVIYKLEQITAIIDEIKKCKYTELDKKKP